MNHQPFEAWLILEEELLPEQIRQLEAHLAGCPTCSRLANVWGDVRFVLRSAPLAQPAPGFSARWQTLLAGQTAQLERRRRSQSWIFFGVMASIALAFLLILSGLALKSFDSPLDLFLSGLYLFTGSLAALSALGKFMVTLLNALILIVPPVGWAALVMTAALLGLAWLLSLRRIFLTRRILP